MDHPSPQYDSLIRSAAQRLKGHQRRLFQAEVTHTLCGGSPRAAERRFGWGRDGVEKGRHEAGSGLRCVENFAAKGAVPREVRAPFSWMARRLNGDLGEEVTDETLLPRSPTTDRRYGP